MPGKHSDNNNLSPDFFSEHFGVWSFTPDTGRENWSAGVVKVLGSAFSGEESFFDVFPAFKAELHEFIKSDQNARLFNLSSPVSSTGFLFFLRRDPEESGASPQITGILHPLESNHSVDATSRETVQAILSAVAQSPGSVVFATDSEGHYTFLAGAGLKHLGITRPETWLGRSIFDFLAEAPRYLETIRRVLNGEYVRDVSNFSDHHFEDHFCPVFDAQGRPRGLIGIQYDITERILADRDLKEQTDLLASLFDGIPDSAVILDLDFNILQINSAAREYFAGRPFQGYCYQALRACDSPCSFCPVVETYRTGNSVSREIYDRNNGRYFELNCFPIRNRKTGKIVGATEFVRDITARKRIEEATRRNEDFLNTLLEVLTDGVYLIDTNYTITHCNRKVDEVYPHLVPLVGRKCYETTTNKKVCPDCAAETMFRTGQVATRTFFEKNSEDEPGGWFELTAFPQYDAETGTIGGAICIVRDVTPRIEMESQLDDYRIQIQKMAEKQMSELRLSEARLRSILETSGAAISFCDHQGRFTYVNGKYREMFGYPEEELYGKPLTHINAGTEADKSESMLAIETAFHSKSGHFRTVQELSAKDGRRIWADINVSVIRGDRPEETQLVSVLVDVTSQWERNRMLSQAKNDAEAASEAKSQFLATMSHEIRTPLNGVIGISDLLLGTKLQTKQLEYAKLIKSSGESLLFLINDILDFSKIEAGKLELDRISFNLHDLTESVSGILASRASEKSLELVVTFDKNVPRFVWGDPGRLRQILLNLVGNGLKFTEQGGVRIHVTTLKSTREKAEIRFDVMDSGIGIPPERIDRLFKRFSQVDASSARVYGGTGLGLAISKKLSEMMGGGIHVESVFGQGSTFWFTVVLDLDEASNHKRAKAKACQDAPVGISLALERPPLVLVACDNAIQRPALVEQFDSWGMDVRVPESLPEAMEMLALPGNVVFSLAVIDSAFNGSQGEDLLHRLQDGKATSQIPAVFLAPLSEEPRKKSWPYPERIRFLSKPTQASALLDAVNDLLLGTDIYYGQAEHTSGIFLPTPQASDYPSLSVLIAEDNRVNQIVISGILENAGMSCEVVEDGRAALEAVQRREYDAILMDCQMPVLDGYEATQQIRVCERDRADSSHLPIIALTANATSEDEAKCLAAGMDAYCVKPVDPQRIIDLIHAWTIRKPS